MRAAARAGTRADRRKDHSAMPDVERTRSRRKLAWRSCTHCAGSGKLWYSGYRIPRPTSDVEYARYCGHDVAELDKIEVRVELRHIEHALATSHRARHVVDRDWLIARHARLRARMRA
jgi:hypothetical protein